MLHTYTCCPACLRPSHSLVTHLLLPALPAALSACSSRMRLSAPRRTNRMHAVLACCPHNAQPADLLACLPACPMF